MCEASKRSRSELSSSSSVSSPLTKLRHLSEGGSPFKTDMNCSIECPMTLGWSQHGLTKEKFL